MLLILQILRIATSYDIFQTAHRGIMFHKCKTSWSLSLRMILILRNPSVIIVPAPKTFKLMLWLLPLYPVPKKVGRSRDTFSLSSRTEHSFRDTMLMSRIVKDYFSFLHSLTYMCKCMYAYMYVLVYMYRTLYARKLRHMNLCYKVLPPLLVFKHFLQSTHYGPQNSLFEKEMNKPKIPKEKYRKVLTWSQASRTVQLDQWFPSNILHRHDNIGAHENYTIPLEMINKPKMLSNYEG